MNRQSCGKFQIVYKISACIVWNYVGDRKIGKRIPVARLLNSIGRGCGEMYKRFNIEPASKTHEKKHENKKKLFAKNWKIISRPTAIY